MIKALEIEVGLCHTVKREVFSEDCGIFIGGRRGSVERYALGIDIGTTSVKVLLISESGKIVAEAVRGHDLLSPYQNWAEEKADIWWSNTVEAVREISQKKPDELRSTVSIGCSGMVPAIVLLDEQGRPVRNTIQQNDARAIDQIDRVTAALDQELLYEQTGGRTNQQHIIPRLLWVKENEPEVWARVRWIMGSYDYIVYMLSGERSLELNWAAESGCYDIRRGVWLTEQLERFGIPASFLPPVNEPTRVVARTKPELEALMGLPGGIPIVAGSADHVASTLAAGIVDEGDLLIKFGGAGDILYCTEKLETSPKLFFDYHDVPGKYLLNGCMAASGSLVKWYTKDVLRSDDPQILKTLDREAEALPAASDGLIVLPYFLGEKTPLFDPTARGVIFGLTLSHTRAHIFRAILESVVYGFRHHIDVLTEMGYRPRQIIATDGGAKSPLWCQISADVLGAPVRAYPSHPGSALGVAFVAGMSAGLFSDWGEIRSFLSDWRDYEPQPDAVKVYDRAYALYRGLYPALQNSCQGLRSLYENV